MFNLSRLTFILSKFGRRWKWRLNSLHHSLINKTMSILKLRNIFRTISNAEELAKTPTKLKIPKTPTISKLPITPRQLKLPKTPTKLKLPKTSTKLKSFEQFFWFSFFFRFSFPIFGWFGRSGKLLFELTLKNQKENMFKLFFGGIH